MKICIVLFLSVFGVIQAQEKNVGFEFFMSLASIEAPLKYKNENTQKCYDMIKGEYEKAYEKFNDLFKDTDRRLTKKFEDYKTISRALNNLKVMIEQWRLCQEHLEKRIAQGKFKEAAALVWECRKDIAYHYEKYNTKMKGVRYFHKTMHNIVREDINEILLEAKKDCKVQVRNLKGCLREIECSGPSKYKY